MIILERATPLFGMYVFGSGDDEYRMVDVKNPSICSNFKHLIGETVSIDNQPFTILEVRGRKSVHWKGDTITLKVVLAEPYDEQDALNRSMISDIG